MTVSTQPRVGRLPVAGAAGSLLARARALPRAIWACMALAVLNGVIWSVLVPPGQAPDEPAHASYVQTIATGHGVPRSGSSIRELPIEWTDLVAYMPWGVEAMPIWAKQEDRRLRQILAPLPMSSGGPNYVTANPPLYYAYDAIGARAASGLDFFNRLLVMRVLSALLAGVTVGFVFLFMREVLPGTPWAWTVGALAVAFHPLFGHISGSVQVDNMLYLTSAALFYLMARAFRRGLTPKLGAGIGFAALAGLLAKGTTFGLLPGVAIGLALLAWRTPRERRGQALVALAVAAAVLALPYAGWLYANTTFLHRDAGTTTGGLTGRHFTQNTSLRGQLSYTWEFFLPRLPFMTARSHFPANPHYGLWNSYIEGWIGRFGWFQYGFPSWANLVGAAVLAAIAAGAVFAFRRMRGVFTRRRLELLTYALMFVGLVLLISVAGYRYQATTHFSFEQARYLLPAAALWAAIVPIGAIGLGGRRYGPAVAVFFTILIVSDTLFAYLLTLGRFWGYLYG